MPAGKKHNHDHYPVVPQTSSSYRLAELPISADRHCNMPSALLTLSKSTPAKKLRWAAGTIDNENRKTKAHVITDDANASQPSKPSSDRSGKISKPRHQNPVPGQGHQTRPSNIFNRHESSRKRPPPALPPWVPDAPRLKPPSAPRPARLPTPDLPEIDGEMFYPAMVKINKMLPSYSKMDAQRTFYP